MKDFVLNRAMLSDEEKKEILTALRSIHSMSGVQESQTLRKLSAVFQTAAEDWLEVDFSRWGNEGTDQELFETLKTAILQKKV